MGKRVLLVDDELHILRAAEFKLKRAGFHVQCASDGEEAWERIQAGAPDILVTDLQMPRLGGLQLIQRLRAHPDLADLPVILLTAKGFELARDELVGRYRVADLVPKPFSPRDLCRRVEAALAGQRSAPATQPAAEPAS